MTIHKGTKTYVRDIKVDEMAGYLISTSPKGGLYVTDLDTNQELWSLPGVRLESSFLRTDA